MWWQYALICFAMACIDYLWTRCVLAIGKGVALEAALWSSAIVVANAFVTVEYVHNPRMIGAAGVGAFLGTLAAVRRQ